jgi:hypothetical protein
MPGKKFTHIAIKTMHAKTRFAGLFLFSVDSVKEVNRVTNEAIHSGGSDQTNRDGMF